MKVDFTFFALVSGWQQLSLCYFPAQVPPEKFVETLRLMEHRYGAKDFVTTKGASLLAPGTFYLTSVDSMYRRYYTKKAEDSDGAGANGPLVNGY